eukprot:1145484-Pelagomonas_calceolata.AAC.3
MPWPKRVSGQHSRACAIFVCKLEALVKPACCCMPSMKPLSFSQHLVIGCNNTVLAVSRSQPENLDKTKYFD